jgi:hypothetical protein
MPKKCARKGAFRGFLKSKPFPETAVKMHHSKLFLFPENLASIPSYFQPHVSIFDFLSLDA